MSPVGFRLALWAAAGAAGLALGGAWWLLDSLPTDRLDAFHVVLFVLAAVVTERLPMRQPGGRAVAASIAIIGTLALLGATPAEVALVAGLGWLLARLVERRGLRLRTLAMRVLGGWTLAGVAAVGAALGPRWIGTAAHDGSVASLDLGAALALTLAVVVGLPALQAASQVSGRLVHMPRRATEAVTRTWMAGVAVSSTALLGGLVHDVLGAWTLPTMVIPLLAARVGLDRFAVAARAYDQTVRAMSRLPEQLGAVEADHGVRVGHLAVEVGLDLGLDADTLADLEHAAHLHELGRIRLDDPDEDMTRPELARAGASILRETASLDRVAEIIEAHGAPQAARGDVATPARVVAACCAVDRYGPVPGDDGQRHEMLVRLVRDIADLRIVSSIERALERQPVGAASDG